MAQILLQSPTSNLQSSIDFYTTLEFEVTTHTKGIIVTDDVMNILINKERNARAGLVFSKDLWSNNKFILNHSRVLDEGRILKSPTGLHIYLSDEAEFKVPDLINNKSRLGNNFGVGVETVDMHQSYEFWTKMGFSKTMGEPTGGFMILSHPCGFNIGLMDTIGCPHLFFNPSLSFFNGANNMNIIDDVRKLGIPIVEEITHFNKDNVVDNIIIRDPGGLGFFLFSDG